MFSKVLTAVLCAIPAGVLLAAPPTARAQTFQPLGDLPGGSFSSVATAISADGSTVVGHSVSGTNSEAFRWTRAGGMQGLGQLYPSTDATAVNADGSIVVGIAGSGNTVAFRWTQSTGMVGLGTGGASASEASGISGDGSVIVGALGAYTNVQGFRWTADTGIVRVPRLPTSNVRSAAMAVSLDGSTTVGYSEAAGSYMEAFSFSGAAELQALGDLAGGGVHRVQSSSAPPTAAACTRPRHFAGPLPAGWPAWAAYRTGP
jgi:probable HAF family extracellular repeat protein